MMAIPGVCVIQQQLRLVPLHKIQGADVFHTYTERERETITRLEETFKIIESNPTLTLQLDHGTECHVQSFFKHIFNFFCLIAPIFLETVRKVKRSGSQISGATSA